MAARPTPLDLLLFANEGPTRPMHMAMADLDAAPESRLVALTPVRSQNPSSANSSPRYPRAIVQIGFSRPRPGRRQHTP